MLWGRDVAKTLTNYVVLDYCQYNGPGYRKRTRIAHSDNIQWIPRPSCNPTTCPQCVGGKHLFTAQRGPGKGKQSDNCPLDLLHALPRELTEEILKVCESHVWEMAYIINMDSITNGLTQGNFTLLQVLDPTTNQLVNILTLINSATGGIQTAQAPLALNAGVLSIDLSTYSSTTAIQTLLNNYTDTAGLNTILAGFTNTTALNTLLTNYVLSTTLTSTLANYTDTAGLNTILAGFTNTTTLNTLLGSYVLTTTLTSTLSNYTDTTGLNTMLSNKQNTFSVTGQGVFLNGSVLNGYDLRWNTSNTPTVPIHCLRFEDLSVVQNLNLTSGQLELQVSASNKQDNISVTLPVTLTGSTIDTLWKPSNLSVSTGLGVTNNDSAGTSFLYLTGMESRVALKLQDSNQVLKEFTHNTSGRLVWDGDIVETSSTLSPQLALKQNKLLWVDEFFTGGTLVYGPTSTTSWLPTNAFSNQTGYQNITGAVYRIAQHNPTPGQYLLYLQARSSTTPSLVISNSSTDAIQVDLTSDWKIYTHMYEVVAGASYTVIELGLNRGGYTQATPIDFDVKDVQLELLPAHPYVHCSPDLVIQGDLRIRGSTVSISDESVKDEVEIVSPSKCMQILTSVDAKVYKRIDMDSAQQRIGFLAQDVQQAMTDANLDVNNVVMQGPSLLGLDYSRLVSILWAVCKQQEERIQALEAKN